jgi:hypothetical protein
VLSKLAARSCCTATVDWDRREQPDAFSASGLETAVTVESKPRISDDLQKSVRPVNAAAVEHLANLLREAEQEHHKRPAADWPPWYAAYISERQFGASVEDAAVGADRYTPEQTK